MIWRNWRPRRARLALAAGGLALLVAGVLHLRAGVDDRAAAPERAAMPRATARVEPARMHPVEPVTGAASRRRTLVPDQFGLRLPVADSVPSRLPADGVPAGWRLRQFTGRAEVELVRIDDVVAVRLRSENASFALYRDVVVDLREFPVLTWSWKVARLPARGDVRRAVTDDQAAQIYVVFPRWPSPRTRSDVIGYVWDTTAPAGTRAVSPKASNVHVVVVESGSGRLGIWLRYERNVLEDYQALFGRPAPRVGGLALMTDANDTRGRTDALVGELAFVRLPRKS